MKVLFVTGFATATALLLSACGDGGAMRGQRAMERERFAERCEQRGYQRGSSAFDSCVRRLSDQAVIERFREYKQITP